MSREFLKFNDKVVPTSRIVETNFTLMATDLVAIVSYERPNDIKIESVRGIEAIELAMNTQPSVLEDKRLKHAKLAWFVHNMFGHPAMQLFALFGAYKLAFWCHDATVPRPRNGTRS